MEGVSKFAGSGAGQVVLPLLMGAASVFAPRVAGGLAGGLQLATSMGELNRRRDQANTTRDYLAGLASQGKLIGDIDPTKVTDEMLPGIVARQQEAATPQRWPMTIGEEHGIAEMARTPNAKPSFTPMGEVPPSWDQAHKTKGYILFKKTRGFTPEEMGQIDQSIETDAEAKRQRELQTYFDKQEGLLYKQQGLQEQSNINAQNRQDKAYNRQAFERDIASGRNMYMDMNNKFVQGNAAVDKWFKTQNDNLSKAPLTSAQKQQQKQELSAQYLEEKNRIKSDYDNSYQVWEDTFSHVRQHLPDPKRTMRKLRGGAAAPAAPANAERPWMNME